MKDVARRAGVSVATVSNVLSGDKPVRAASVEKVTAAVKALNYRVNPAASYLRSGRSKIIAAVVPSLDNPFFPKILAAVEAVCQKDGFELIVASSANQPDIEDARIRALMHWKPAGFIVIPCSGDLPARKQIEAAHIPLVFADRSPDGAVTDFVEIDNVTAGAAAARHLAQLGHRRITVCTPSMLVRNLLERIEGVAQVLAEFGVRPVVVETGLGDVPEALSGEAEAQIVGADAIVALMNTTTLQVLGALNRAGRSIPGDVSLVWFDDYSWMPAARPPITAIRQPVELIGRLAWSRLFERITGASGEAVHRRLPVELVLRESTAPPRLGRAQPALPLEGAAVLSLAKRQ
jgi:LacI family transcriptional regulator